MTRHFFCNPENPKHEWWKKNTLDKKKVISSAKFYGQIAVPRVSQAFFSVKEKWMVAFIETGALSLCSPLQWVIIAGTHFQCVNTKWLVVNLVPGLDHPSQANFELHPALTASIEVSIIIQYLLEQDFYDNWQKYSLVFQLYNLNRFFSVFFSGKTITD